MRALLNGHVDALASFDLAREQYPSTPTERARPPQRRLPPRARRGRRWGDPRRREPALVLGDVREEKISVDYARRHDGVVVDPATWTVRREETAALRTP